jgi:hypothetical protein
MAVVRPTKLVRVTRKTFSGSMIELAVPGEQRPTEITSTVSRQVATKVPRLNATLISRAMSRCPVNARTTLPKQRDAEDEVQRFQVSLP